MMRTLLAHGSSAIFLPLIATLVGLAAFLHPLVADPVAAQDSTTAVGKELLMPPCAPDADAVPAAEAGAIKFVMCDDNLTIESVATASDVTFYPAFSPDRQNYVVHVADSVTKLKILGEFKDSAKLPWSDDLYHYPGRSLTYATEGLDPPASRSDLLVSHNISDIAVRVTPRQVELNPGVTVIQIGALTSFKKHGLGVEEYKAYKAGDKDAFMRSANMTRKPYILQLVWKSPSTTLAAPTEPDGPARTTDYDTDDDGLIEISTLAQLDAIRWDGDGDGYSDHGGPLHLGFPNSLARLGCPESGCKGYELTADLDFDTNGSASADAGDDYWNHGHGWVPIGMDTEKFTGIFEGNGNVIRNLYIDSTDEKQSKATDYPLDASHPSVSVLVDPMGLFSRVGPGGAVRNLGLESVDLSRKFSCNSGASYHYCIHNHSGGLVGENWGAISGSYATGRVSNWIFDYDGSGSNSVFVTAGGLVGYGHPGSVIKASYAMTNVSGVLSGVPPSGYPYDSDSGGLVGRNKGSIIASYSTGRVDGSRRVGGMVGRNSGPVTASYWDTQTSGKGDSSGGVGKTTAELQATAETSTADPPDTSYTPYAGIYAGWNVDLDGDGSEDDPWDFGTTTQYPLLKDVGRQHTASQEVTPPEGSPERQSADCPTPSGGDYDSDDDGLIEVCSVDQLNAVKMDLNGDGYPHYADYARAFPNAAAGMGCPSGGCKGYELTADLDVGSRRAFPPIGGWAEEGGKDGFSAIFEGNGHAIRNFSISGFYPGSGLFSVLSPGGVIRNLMLENADVSGRNRTGALVGINYGAVSNVHVTGGRVHARVEVGGLVGLNGSTGIITDSSSSGQAKVVDTRRDGGRGAGGLVGRNAGSIRKSYSTAHVNVGDSYHTGGLVGYNSGTIVASYATGNVQSDGVYYSRIEDGLTFGRYLGGLVGYNSGTIRASYSTGTASGGSDMGGLVGASSGGTATASYWDNQNSGQTNSAQGIGKTTAELQVPTDYTGIYAGWNVDMDGDGNGDDPWDFGTSSQYPALKGLSLSVAQQRGGPDDPVPSPPEGNAETQGTFSVSDAATVAEGKNATLTVTLSEAAPTDGVALTVTADFAGDSTATAVDVGSIASPVMVVEGGTTLDITIPTAYDYVDDDDETFTVTVAASTAGWVKAGDGKDTATITITNVDTAGITVLPTILNLSEGSSGVYTVVLDSKPTADVTVSVSSEDVGAVSISPETYVFSPSDWNTPRTFTVSGVADEDTDDETSAVSHQATSQDAKYSGIIVNSVAVAVTDTTPEPEKQVGDTKKPGPVENLQVSLSVDGVTVSWDAPQSGDAPDKYIARLIPAEGKHKVKEPKADKTSVTFGNPEAGATYEVKVRAQNAAGKGQPVSSSVTVPELPGAAVNLRLLATADSITASWEAPESGGTPAGYLLNIKNTGSGEDEHRSVGADVTSAVFGGLDAGATYRVWLRAVNAGGKGERVRATTTLPEAPQEPDPEPQQTARTFSVTDTASSTEGGAASLTVTLSEAAPAGGVSFTVTAGYGSTATSGDVGSVTSPVTVGEGNITLDISVPTVDDDIDEDDETFTVTVAATTDGWEKEGDGSDTAIVTIRDDDTAGVTVSPTTLDISEGGSATYTVVLNSRPTSDVTVTASSGDVAAVSVSPASWTFTATGWNTAQTFTVSGVSDEDTDDERVAIRHQAASSDAGYGGIIVNSVAVSVEDNTPEPEKQVEEPQQTVKTYSVTSTASASEGSDATLTVTLSEAAPAGGVTFTVTAGYGSTATSGDVGSITSPVTVGEENTTLDIAVPTVDDDIDEDDETFTVTVATVTEGWEKEGDGRDIATITITDDDTAGVTVTPTNLNIGEDGSGSYTVVLHTRPTSDVTVEAVSGDGGAVSVSPASWTFTPSSWNMAQTFTVSGVGDDDQDDESVSVDHVVTGGDGKYGGITVESVAASVSDTTPAPSEPEKPITSWRDYDTNGNGCIDPDEYLEAVYDYAAAKISTTTVMSVVENRCE